MEVQPPFSMWRFWRRRDSLSWRAIYHNHCKVDEGRSRPHPARTPTMPHANHLTITPEIYRAPMRVLNPHQALESRAMDCFGVLRRCRM